MPAPLWMEAGRGLPTLMLFSAVDDRSRVAYQELLIGHPKLRNDLRRPQIAFSERVGHRFRDEVGR